MKIVVFISGNGSNLQAIIDAQKNGLGISIEAVISNKSDAFGLQRAKMAGIQTETILSKDFSTRHSFDLVLKEATDRYQPALIVMAGFMRILSPVMTEAYKNKIINIHPSLLPKFPGLNTHERVIIDKENHHGCSVHFVDELLDHGPILAQASLTIGENENPISLQKKVQRLEHRLYPQVLQYFVEDRVAVQQEIILLDNKPLPSEGLQFFFEEENVINAELF